MTRESEICRSLGLDRKELRAARKSGKYDYGDDWCKVANAICWTDAGRAKLAGKIDADPADLTLGDGAEIRAVVLPGRVLNPKLIRCSVEGEAGWQAVYVGHNGLYRAGMDIWIFYEGNGWKAGRRPKLIDDETPDKHGREPADKD